MQIIKESFNDDFDESFGSKFNKGYDQSITYFGEGIVNLSQTTDIDKMPEKHQKGWLEKNCDVTRLGGGSFRNVFVLNSMPEFVVKVAYTRQTNWVNEGRKYNKIEIEQFNRYNEMFPRVYAYDKKQYCWFIADREIPIEDEETLGEVVINTFSSFNTISQQIKNSGVNIDIDKSHIKRMFAMIMSDLLWRESETPDKLTGQKIVDLFNNLRGYSRDYLISIQTAFIALINLMLDPDYGASMKNIFESDTKLMHFFNMIKQLKMNDLAYGNIGTNVNHDRLIILDHSAE